MLSEMYEYKIGNTPIHEMDLKNGNKLFIKLEKFNFMNSIKSRTAYYIVKNLEMLNNRGVVESTSGNLGLALNFFLKEENIKFLCIIDESISKEKLEKLKKQGVNYQFVQKDNDLDFRSSRIKMARRLEESGSYYWCNQYKNINSMLAHYLTTAPEIWQQRDGKIDVCICPVGSGGTISGMAKFLKEKNKQIQIIGVEPLGSTIFGGEDGDYLNAGTGLKGPSPLILKHISYIDGYYQISDDESVFYCKKLKAEHGLELGISSGMTFAAVIKYTEDVSDQNIVMISPDGMESYQSVFEE